MTFAASASTAAHESAKTRTSERTFGKMTLFMVIGAGASITVDDGSLVVIILVIWFILAPPLITLPVIIFVPPGLVIFTQDDISWLRSRDDYRRWRRCLVDDYFLLGKLLADDYGCGRRVRCGIILYLPAIMLKISVMGVPFLDHTAFNLQVSLFVVAVVIVVTISMDINNFVLHHLDIVIRVSTNDALLETHIGFMVIPRASAIPLPVMISSRRQDIPRFLDNTGVRMPLRNVVVTVPFEFVIYGSIGIRTAGMWWVERGARAIGIATTVNFDDLGWRATNMGMRMPRSAVIIIRHVSLNPLYPGSCPSGTNLIPRSLVASLIVRRGTTTFSSIANFALSIGLGHCFAFRATHHHPRGSWECAVQKDVTSPGGGFQVTA
jgi:hypothetical protein